MFDENGEEKKGKRLPNEFAHKSQEGLAGNHLEKWQRSERCRWHAALMVVVIKRKTATLDGKSSHEEQTLHSPRSRRHRTFRHQLTADRRFQSRCDTECSWSRCALRRHAPQRQSQLPSKLGHDQPHAVSIASH